MISRVKKLYEELLFLFQNRKKLVQLIKKENSYSVKILNIGINYQIDDLAVIRNPNGKLKIGDNFKLGVGANLLTYGGSIEIGNNSLINNYSVVYGNGGVKIGDNTQIAANCTIISANHNFSFLNIPIMFQGETTKGIEIGNNVWVGANSVILDGVRIGDNTIIGAGSVVAKSIPENCIAQGNPAKVLRKRMDFNLESDLNKISLPIIDYVYEKEKEKHEETIEDILSFDPILVRFLAGEERAFPGDENFMKTGYSHTMLKRYFFAGKMFCENKKVLDSCCGIGWGSKILGIYSKEVVAFDIEQKAIEFSNNYWNLKNVKYIEGDALNNNFLQGEKFDVVTAFETIEHFSKADGEKYIFEMSKVLNVGGLLIGTSTFPNNDVMAKKIRMSNPEHLHIFTEIQLRIILEKYFKSYHVINQWLFVALK